MKPSGCRLYFKFPESPETRHDDGYCIISAYGRTWKLDGTPIREVGPLSLPCLRLHEIEAATDQELNTSIALLKGWRYIGFSAATQTLRGAPPEHPVWGNVPVWTDDWYLAGSLLDELSQMGYNWFLSHEALERMLSDETRQILETAGVVPSPTSAFCSCINPRSIALNPAHAIDRIDYTGDDVKKTVAQCWLHAVLTQEEKRMAVCSTIAQGTNGLSKQIVICGCDMQPAEGLYRGAYWDPDEQRNVVVNRWLCEQCYNNLNEMPNASLCLIRRQSIGEFDFEIVEQILAEWQEAT